MVWPLRSVFEVRLPTAELCRRHGITEQTYYRWKAKYGGMESGDQDLSSAFRHTQARGKAPPVIFGSGSRCTIDDERRTE